jgi:hypothetical protein
MVERPENLENQDIVEVRGKRCKRRYIGDMEGFDGQLLTERRYYSHSGPGWDYRWGYLKRWDLDDIDGLSDDPYVYEPLDVEDK